jgi:hypothetical protein
LPMDTRDGEIIAQYNDFVKSLYFATIAELDSIVVRPASWLADRRVVDLERSPAAGRD